MTIGIPTEDDLKSLRRWVADPVYKLQREIIGRVLEGIAARDAEIARLQSEVDAHRQRTGAYLGCVESAMRIAQLEAALRNALNELQCDDIKAASAELITALEAK